MELMLRPIAFLAVLGNAVTIKSYSGYQVLKTAPLIEEDMPHIIMLSQRYDFWGTPGIGSPATVMVAPEEAHLLATAFNRLNILHKVYTADLGPIVAGRREEREALKHAFPRRPSVPLYDRYMEYHEIQQLIQELIAANPKTTSLLVVANTTERRELQGIKLTNGSVNQKAVWFDCAIHAREWISTPVCLRIINEVLADSSLRNLADWYILPVANPDGYNFSMAIDPFWRKTRSPNPDSSCSGTDANRNFDFFWSSGNQTDYCSAIYPGTKACSEPEVAGIAKLILEIANRLDLYVAVHSFGNKILYPYGHTLTPVPNVDQLIAAATASAKAIAAVAGTNYSVENSAAGIYFTYGASDDFAYGRGAVKYAFTYEVNKRGFHPPEHFIRNVVDEVWPGIKALVQYILDK